MPGMATSTTSSVLTLDDLVHNEQLGLTVVGAADPQTRVRGAHTMELEHPARWLEPGWIMLTTGLRFVGEHDLAAQTELVRELKAGKAAALAFGVGVHFDTVPAGLVQAAAEVGLPLLTVASEVPFLQVESFVNRSLASAETYLVKRTLWLQNDLLEALSAEQPLTALINRLGHLIKGVALVYDEAGAVVASTGAGPARLIWAEIRAREPRRQHFVVGRWHVSTRPTVLGGMGYWIAIGSPRESVMDDLAEPILDSAQRLLGAIRGARVLQATQARAEARELLTTLHGVIEPGDVPRLWERLSSFRFVAQAPVRAFVASELPVREGVDERHPEATLDRLAEEAQANGLPLIFRPREADEPPGVVGLAADSALLHEWLDDLGRTHHVGMSEPFADLGLARRSFRDAGRASLVAHRRAYQRITLAHLSAGHKDSPAPLPDQGWVVRFEDVDLATWLMSSRSAEAIRDKTRQQLGELLDRPDLVDTIAAYLASGLDVATTAKRLYLHPNSVRYRLRRVEEIVDGPITAPAVLANLYLAFHERLATEDTWAPSPEQG